MNRKIDKYLKMADYKLGDRTRTHGQSSTKLYKAWKNMKVRCYNKKNKDFQFYGGRGIGVVKEWHKFINFYNWAINNGYKEGLTIDRKDNSKEYSPLNCRWITQKNNCRNRRSTVFLTYNGQTKCIAEWAEYYGINRKALQSRLKSGWPIELALITPTNKPNSLKTLKQWKKNQS